MGGVIYLSGYAPGIRVAAATADGLVVRSTVDSPGDPTYLALAPDGRTRYAAHELPEGLISAFAVAADASLSPLGWTVAVPGPACILPGQSFGLSGSET